MTALDHHSVLLTDPNDSLIANTHYQGRMLAVVGLLNGYLDLGTWRSFVPYVGAGLATHIWRWGRQEPVWFRMGIDGWFQRGHQHARQFDVGYRYINFGADVAATTGVFDCVCGVIGQPLKIGDLDVQAFQVGRRVPLGLIAELNHHQPLK